MGTFADDFPLAPMAAVPVSFTVDGRLVPYALEWFNDTKLSGESVEAFLNRLIGVAAVNHRSQKLISEVGQDGDAAQITEGEQINTDATAVLDDVANNP